MLLKQIEKDMLFFKTKKENKLIKIGEVNKLEVISENNSGFFLDHADRDESVFLPGTLAPKGTSVGDELEVFVNVDNQGSLLATMEIPNTLLGEFGFLEVVSTRDFGAFLNWGVTKDLFVPDNEQRERVRVGERHIIRVCKDENTDRIYGTTKINKFIQTSEFDIQEGDKVQITPVLNEELGYRSIINKKYIGMIYHNEIFQKIEINIPLEGRVKKIRDDGLIDASLQIQGFKNILNSKDKILAYLKEVGGTSPLHDKSSPEEIRSALNMSKQTFKNAIGMLYKDKVIIIKKDGIELVENK